VIGLTMFFATYIWTSDSMVYTRGEVHARGSLNKHSEQTLFIRFHSANRIIRKRPFTASLYSYITALRRTTYFTTFKTHDV